MASWVLIGFLNISWRHLHDLIFVHSLVLPPALKFYPPPDRNFFLLQIATFAEGKFKCICRAVVSDFFSAILLDIPAEQFWWNIDLIGEKPAFVNLSDSFLCILIRGFVWECVFWRWNGDRLQHGCVQHFNSCSSILFCDKNLQRQVWAFGLGESKANIIILKVQSRREREIWNYFLQFREEKEKPEIPFPSFEKRKINLENGFSTLEKRKRKEFSFLKFREEKEIFKKISNFEKRKRNVYSLLKFREENENFESKFSK